ncbi:MAG TPA: hypothetical protein VNN15_03305, partial [Solirubrobacterales bacterium]|nr:hypothetical protein [Solirubrobacterales bacterium]
IGPSLSAMTIAPLAPALNSRNTSAVVSSTSLLVTQHPPRPAMPFAPQPGADAAFAQKLFIATPGGARIEPQAGKFYLERGDSFDKE